ncbi:MAG: hypothetical protein V4675_04870 [Verrucomicrobiota bacterium]
MRFVIVSGNPSADGLPKWVDRLQGFDVERRVRRWREADQALPEAMEAKEKFYILKADDDFDAAHGAGATRVFQGIVTPEAAARRKWSLSVRRMVG